MNSPRYLTKSRFKLAVECPTKLFYVGKEQIYRNTKQDDSILALLAEGGYQVGALAKCRYPEGHEVATLNHTEAEAETARLLERDDVVIFEPAIRHRDLFVRIDILIKQGNAFKLIEVKAKSYDSRDPAMVGKRGDITPPMRPYIEDVAFQVHVLRSAFPTAAVTAYMMMPDKSITANVDGLNQLFKIVRQGNRTRVMVDPRAKREDIGQNLLALVNVDEYVDMVLNDGVACNGFKALLPELASEWAVAYKNDLKVPPIPGAQCAHCEFRAAPGDTLKSGFEECWKETFALTDDDFRQGTVLDLWKHRRKGELIRDGKIRLNSVERHDLGAASDGMDLSNADRQWLQVDGIPPEEDRGGYWISDSLMRSEIAKWKFPYHLIDFETSSVALPFHAGIRPYEQVAFQFSHHLLHADGRVEHVGQFLSSEPGCFPNFEFARELKRQLEKDEGTVFMWSWHENTIIERITQQLLKVPEPLPDAPELVNFLRSLSKGSDRAMYDLCALSRQAYFHVDTKGSNSIKEVLPAMLKSSTLLRERYGKPIYGAVGGIPSLNFKDFVWYTTDDDGTLIEPYERLRIYAEDLLGEEISEAAERDALVIAEGGAAATAYARLQFEDLSDEDRTRINEALLRYCELDTLAMVMIVEGWLNLLR